MGIVLRQSIKSSIYSYLGVIVGFVTVVYLMPNYLTKPEIGLRQQIISYATTIGSIFALGIPVTMVRMYPKFKDEKQKDYGILFFTLLFFVCSSVLMILAFPYLGPIIFEKDLINSEIFQTYHHLVLPVSIAYLGFILMDAYASARSETTLGFLFRDFGVKMMTLLILLLFIVFPWFSYKDFITGFSYLQFAPIVLIMGVLIVKKKFPLSIGFKFPTTDLKKEFVNTSAFNWINVMSGMAMNTIDVIMISKLMGSEEVAVYATVSYFAVLMLIPHKGMSKIANTLFAQFIKSNEWKQVDNLFNKTTNAQLVLAVFFYANLIFCLPIIFEYMLTDFDSGFWVVVLLGLTHFIKMATGLKANVIGHSKYYKFNTYFLVSFIILLVVTNWIFIPIYGITGAALASLISSAIYQLAGVLFVNQKFHIQPFKADYFKMLGIGTMLFAVVYFIPIPLNNLLSSLIKVALFSAALGGYAFKIGLHKTLKG